MKKIFTGLFACLWLASAANVPYRITVPVHEEVPGTKVYLMDFDKSVYVDSAVVETEQVVFTGEVDTPWVGRILTNDSRICTLIVEEGSVAVNREKRRGTGMMYNDMLNALADKEMQLADELDKVTSQEAYSEIFGRYVDMLKQTVDENSDNPVGYLAFLDLTEVMSPDEIIGFIEAHPELGDYTRVQKMKDSALVQIETSEGKPFKDFEVTYEGKTERLSDYVGKGKYTLVDFWASWCGPCMREMPVLKDIYSKYADKGLQVLGVAVWDEPENSLRAIETKKLPWHSIINAQTIPTDAYGIAGIPCIILFGPDGTIVSRGARGEQLKAIVAEAMGE